MTRVVYIFQADDQLNHCADRLKRTSEDGVHIKEVDVEELQTYDYTDSSDIKIAKFLTPFLQKYQGWCAVVDSNYNSKFDIDRFFNYAILKNESPVVHFTEHNVLVFDCSDPVLKELNPHSIKTKPYQEILDETNISTVNDIWLCLKFQVY